jgi:hypothetical protein
MSTPQTPDEDATKKPQKEARGCLWAFLGVMALPLVLFVSCMAGASGGHESSPTGEEWAVLDTCHEAVEKSLKDPDSAQYDTETATMKSSHDGGASWEASGTVRAKNSFGGYAANTYTCTVSYTQTGEQYTANAVIK